MIQMTYRSFRDPGFNQALAHLQSVQLPTKVAYNVMKITRRLSAEGEIAQELFTKIINRHAKKDEQGKLIPQEGRPGTFQVDPEHQDGFQKEILEMESLEFKIECHKIRVADLEGVKMTAAELTVLEPLLMDLAPVESAEAAG